LTTNPEEQGQTAPIDLPATPDASSPPSRAKKPVPTRPTNDLVSPAPIEPSTVAAEPQESVATPPVVEPPDEMAATPPLAAPVVARPASRVEQDIMFVPLAVNVGDGFKFGCGFFLALVVAMLIGFVLFAALFVLTNLFGLNLPISR
jgi:hypothetical protein